MIGPVEASDRVWAAARKVAAQPPSEWEAGLSELREALDDYDAMIDHLVDALGGEAGHDERADPEGPALSGSHHSGANSRPDASPHGPSTGPPKEVE